MKKWDRAGSRRGKSAISRTAYAVGAPVDSPPLSTTAAGTLEIEDLASVMIEAWRRRPSRREGLARTWCRDRGAKVIPRAVRRASEYNERYQSSHSDGLERWGVTQGADDVGGTSDRGLGVWQPRAIPLLRDRPSSRNLDHLQNHGRKSGATAHDMGVQDRAQKSTRNSAISRSLSLEDVRVVPNRSTDFPKVPTPSKRSEP